MKNLKMRVISLAAAAAFAIGLNASANADTGQTFIAQIQAHGSLRVGVDEGKPLIFKDPTSGQWQGIFLDAMQSWADTLKVKLEPVPTTWGNMVAGLQAGQFDVAAALNPTPERSVAVVFSDPLISEIGAFAVRRKSGLSDWGAINTSAHTVCVGMGSAPDLVLTSEKPAANILRLKGESECQLALTSGRADAFYWAVGDLTAFASADNDVGLVFPPAPFQRQGTAFAFQPGIDLQSLASFNITLAAFINSGAFAASKEKWGFVGVKDFAIGTVPAYVTDAGY